MPNKLTAVVAKVFGLYFLGLGIWTQDKLVGISACVFLLCLFGLEYFSLKQKQDRKDTDAEQSDG